MIEKGSLFQYYMLCNVEKLWGVSYMIPNLSFGSFWYVKKCSKSAGYWQNQVIFELQREPFFCGTVCYVKGAKKSISHFSAFRRYFCVHFGIICHKIHSIENEQKKSKKLNFFRFFCGFSDFVKKSQKSQEIPKFYEISNLFKIFSRKDKHLIFFPAKAEYLYFS